jgi:hypothetical protein
VPELAPGHFQYAGLTRYDALSPELAEYLRMKGRLNPPASSSQFQNFTPDSKASASRLTLAGPAPRHAK